MIYPLPYQFDVRRKNVILHINQINKKIVFIIHEQKKKTHKYKFLQSMRDEVIPCDKILIFSLGKTLQTNLRDLTINVYTYKRIVNFYILI